MTETDFLNLVIGTAGHIDHGKSALVERLTGHHPDTLKEEQNRGLTINLGYATFSLSDGRKVGVIDVPGHERFIKNMVAGASAIQYVIFVIAADDSVMPQTREHLDILEILGVKRGLIALTKVDIVDPELAELASEEIREFVAGTFLEDAPLLPVSSITGAGFDELRAEVERALAEVHVEYGRGPFRMPVQRVFSASGHGTVVTGVPVSGRIASGDTVELLPGLQTSRIRGVQAYGSRIDEAQAGHRAALNLVDIDYHDIERGIVIAAEGMYSATRNVEATFTYAGGNARPLKHLSSIRFHTGTAETVGRISLLDRKTLEPGDTAPAQLFLQDEIAVCEGDRFILRAISPMRTIGGGRIVGVAEGRHRRFRDWLLEHLERKDKAIDGERSAYLAEVIFSQGRTPRTAAELSRHVHVSADEVGEMITELETAGTVVTLSSGRQVLHRAILDQISVELATTMREIHKQHPQALFVPMREVLQRMKLDMRFLEEVLGILIREGSIRRGSEGRIGLPEFAPKLTRKQQGLKERIEVLFRDAGLAPPRREQLSAELSAGKDETARLLDLLHDEGVLVRLKEDRIFHQNIVDDARTTLKDALGERGQLTAAEIKEYLDTSRKNLIPLLEHFDQSGVTVRDGDYRRLASEG